MRLLVDLILTALNGTVGTESRGVASLANFDIVHLKIWNPLLIFESFEILRHCFESTVLFSWIYSKQKVNCQVSKKNLPKISSIEV